MSDYDVVVIGSGAGGMTAAVALANAGKRVLVLEQHYMAGGWCQSFVLDGFRYSPGVHYVGELGEGGTFRDIYEGLGVSGDLEFCKLNEEGYDHYIVGGERFDVPAGMENYRDRLKARFPAESKGIDAYFDRVRKVSSEASTMAKYSSGLKLLQLPFRAPNMVFHGLRKLGGFLDKHISDPLLRAYLVAPAGDYGIPPSEAAFALHAGLVAHYFDGGYYPRGGAYRIPRAYVRQLKRKGGEVRLSTRVKRILLEGGRAVGVELDDGERITAKTVVSNADAEVTLGSLVGREHLSRRLRRKLNRTEWSIGSFGLFMATDMDLKGLGYDSGNYWYYASTDIDRAYSTPPPKFSNDPFAGAFVTITTLKDPSKRKDGLHTLEVFTFMPWDYFSRWAGRPKGERGTEYEELKSTMADRLLKTAERVIPNLSESIVFMEAATPLTNEYYCAGHHGHMYGPAKTRSQIGPGAFPMRSEIPGLYMVGASTLSHGVIGVTYSGLVASAQILGCGISDVLSERGPSLAVYPSERPEEWLSDLKQKRNAAGERVHRGLKASAGVSASL